MEEANSLNKVAAFHKTFEHPIQEKPIIPALERAKLRVSLLAEELKELEEAIENKDLIEVADALCDLQYVLSGAILEFGLGEKFNELFSEVHSSNMSKACISEEEAALTISHYAKKDGTEAYYVEREGKYLVFRKADNKTLKSINYEPAKLSEIIEK